jgi:hypothetical protein
LEKEDNLQALWGAAHVSMYYKKFDLAKNYLQFHYKRNRRFIG